MTERSEPDEISDLSHDLPSVSIIVPAWNDAPLIPGLVSSVGTTDYPNERMELILVAGGTDRTEEVARGLVPPTGLRLRVVRQEFADGKNGAILRGLEAAVGQVIVLLDADSLVTEGWLRELVSALQRGPYDAANGFAMPTGPRTAATEWSVARQRLATVNRDGFFGGGSIALTRDILERTSAIELFDPRVRGAVDLNLYLKLHEHGAHLGYAPYAVLYTPRPATAAEFLRDSVRFNAFSFKFGYADNTARIIQFFRSLAIAFSVCLTLALLLALAIGAMKEGTAALDSFVAHPLSPVFLVSVVACCVTAAVFTKVLIFCRRSLERGHLRYFLPFIGLDLLAHMAVVIGFLVSATSVDFPDTHFKGARSTIQVPKARDHRRRRTDRR